MLHWMLERCDEKAMQVRAEANPGGSLELRRLVMLSPATPT